MYFSFPKWGAKEPQNPENHWVFWLVVGFPWCIVFIFCHVLWWQMGMAWLKNAGLLLFWSNIHGDLNSCIVPHHDFLDVDQTDLLLKLTFKGFHLLSLSELYNRFFWPRSSEIDRGFNISSDHVCVCFFFYDRYRQIIAISGSFAAISEQLRFCDVESLASLAQIRFHVLKKARHKQHSSNLNAV